MTTPYVTLFAHTYLDTVEARDASSDTYPDLVGVDFATGVTMQGTLADCLAVFERAHEQLLAIQERRAEETRDAADRLREERRPGALELLPVTFHGDGQDWTAKRAAEAFIREHDWAVGPSDTTRHRGVMFSSEYAISKWKNLTPTERRQCDAVLVGNGRSGDLVLRAIDTELVSSITEIPAIADEMAAAELADVQAHVESTLAGDELRVSNIDPEVGR